jgi:hypothetical protein
MTQHTPYLGSRTIPPLVCTLLRMSSRTRVSAFAIVTLLLVACGVPPAGQEANDDDNDVKVDPETDNTLNPMAPTNPCPSVTVQTVDGPMGTTGASLLTSCDWFVVTKSNPGVHVKLKVKASSPGTQGIIVSSAALCEESWVQASGWGLTAPHWEWVNGSPVWDPGGDWKPLGVRYEHGIVLGDGKCHFPGPEQLCGLPGCGIKVHNDPMDPDYYPMATVLIATRSRVYAATGLTTLAMTGYIDSHP